MTRKKNAAWAAVGRRIKEERERRGLTQSDLAEAAGLSDKFVSNVENGSRGASLDNLQAIAAALNLAVKDFHSGTPVVSAIDADVATLASILRDASTDDRSRALRIVRALVKSSKARK